MSNQLEKEDIEKSLDEYEKLHSVVDKFQLEGAILTTGRKDHTTDGTNGTNSSGK